MPELLIHQFLFFFFWQELQAVLPGFSAKKGLKDDANGPVPGPATKPFSNQGRGGPESARGLAALAKDHGTTGRPRRLVGPSSPLGFPSPYRSSYHPKAGASDFSETIPSHPISSQEPHPRNQHTHARAPRTVRRVNKQRISDAANFLFSSQPNPHQRFRHCFPSPSQSPAAPAPAAFPTTTTRQPPPTTATMHAAGVVIIVILLLLLAAATGWIVFTRMRAQRLGVRPPLPSPSPPPNHLQPS